MAIHTNQMGIFQQIKCAVTCKQYNAIALIENDMIIRMGRVNEEREYETNIKKV